MRLSHTYQNRALALFPLLFALLISPSLFAQNGGFAGASNRIGYSARGMAMGNAMSAVTTEGAYSYYNPAQAAMLIDKRQTDFSIGALQFDRVFQSSGVQFKLPPTAGLSFNLLRTGVKDIDGRTVSGYSTGLFDINEYQLSSNFGIRLSNKMKAGIGLKFNMADYHSDLDNAIGVGLDFGILYHAGLHTNIALSIKDLFANYKWNAQDLYGLSQGRDVINNFPTRYTLGVAYQRNQVTVSADFEIQSYTSEIQTTSTFVEDGVPTTITSSEEVNTSSTQLRLGSSWRAHQRFTLRAGWQLPNTEDFDSWALSSGFSIHLPFDVFSPSIDYAFVMEPYQISNMHVFSLRLNL